MAYDWRPIELRDPLGDGIAKFDNGLAWGRSEKYEKEAPDTFAKYLDSLGNATTSQTLVPPGSGVTTNALVNSSHEAATAAQDPLLSAFFANTRRSESGGNDSAKNPNSSATGRYQFLEGTWSDLAQRHPELGLTPDGRTDPAQQEAAMRVFTQENAGTLKGSGVPVNPGTLYAAHFLGAGGAAKVLAGDPNSPVSAYVDPAVVQANPQLANMTVGQFAQWASEKGGGSGGGYQPPMAPQAPAAAAPNGLPPREVMLELFRNPNTRPLAIELAKAAQEGRAAKPIEINNRLVDPTTGRVLADFSDESKPLTDLAKLRADLKAGRISQPEFDAAVAKETAINGGTSLRVNPQTGEVEFQQGGAPGTMPKLNEGQSKDVVYLTKGAGALPLIDKFGDALTSLTETAAGGVPLLGNYAKSEEFQQAEQAGKEFLAAVLRKDTGAAVTKPEEDMYGAMYLPRPGDKPAVLTQKKAARTRALKAIELGIPSAAIVAMEAQGVELPGRELAPATTSTDAGAVPDGVDPSLWEVMTPEERALWQE